MMAKRALLVDFDGTLVDSIAALYTIYSAFLQENGAQGSLLEFQELNGPALKDIIALLTERHGLTALPEKLLQNYQKALLQFYTSEALPLKGALEVLKAWKAQERVLALVTAAERSFVDAFLKAHDLMPLFDVISTAEDVQHGKPDPALYHLALKHLNANPEEALAVEDSPNGLKAALGAGIFTFYLRGAGNLPEVRGDWRAIDSWDDVKRWIQTHG